MSSLPCSPAVPMEDDDLLSEILLRLPPLPSSLPRISLVCKRWCSLVSDPYFIRHFRLRHRRNSPLLGFFLKKDGSLSFVPTMESPNRVPSVRFSLQLGDRFLLLGCRHGLVLMLELDQNPKQVLVWDPFTGDQHRFPLPLGFDSEKTMTTNGAVLRAAGDVRHFQVVLVVTHDHDPLHRRALACVYSSKTGKWGKLISTPSTSGVWVSMFMPAVLYGNSLYWQLNGVLFGVLEFDLERQSLAVIPMPADLYAMAVCGFAVTTRAEGGGLGFLIVSDFCAQLWKRVTYCDGISTWVLRRTIELDKLLSLNPEREKGLIYILGFAEDNNVVFLKTSFGVFMVHLESLHFKKLSESMFCTFYPFECVYAAGTYSHIPLASVAENELLGVGSSILYPRRGPSMQHAPVS